MIKPLQIPPTVHKDVTDRLKVINPYLYREVGLVLEQNKQERHMRGGEATKLKYMQMRTTAAKNSFPIKNTSKP